MFSSISPLGFCLYYVLKQHQGQSHRIGQLTSELEIILQVSQVCRGDRSAQLVKTSWQIYIAEIQDSEHGQVFSLGHLARNKSPQLRQATSLKELSHAARHLPAWPGNCFHHQGVLAPSQNESKLWGKLAKHPRGWGKLPNHLMHYPSYLLISMPW